MANTGKRMTRQRKVVLEELQRVTSHPSADEVFGAVRRKLPRISLATVYRNLEVLCETGLARRLEIGGGFRRYDGTVAEHHHIRCTACGRVSDADLRPGNLKCSPPEELHGYQVTGFIVQFQGLCPRCRR